MCVGDREGGDKTTLLATRADLSGAVSRARHHIGKMSDACRTLDAPLLGGASAPHPTTRRCAHASAYTLLAVAATVSLVLLAAPSPFLPLRNDIASLAVIEAKPPREAEKRCEWVVQQVQRHNAGKSPKTLEAQYQLQSTDSNLYYRGVAYMFWHDVRPKARLEDWDALACRH